MCVCGQAVMPEIQGGDSTIRRDKTVKTKIARRSVQHFGTILTVGRDTYWGMVTSVVEETNLNGLCTPFTSA